VAHDFRHCLSSFDSCVCPGTFTRSGDLLLDFTDRSLEIGSCLIISDLDDQIGGILSPRYRLQVRTRLAAGGRRIRTLGPACLARRRSDRGVRKAWGPGWRRPGAAGYVVAAPSASLIQPAGIKHAASSSDIPTMPSNPTVRWRFEKVCTAPMPAGALTRT